MTNKYIKLVKYIGDADLRNFIVMCDNCHNSFNISHPTLSNYSQVFVVPEYLCYVGAVTCPNCGRENIIVFNTLENTRFLQVLHHYKSTFRLCHEQVYIVVALPNTHILFQSVDA